MLAVSVLHILESKRYLVEVGHTRRQRVMIICIHPHHSALQKSLLNAYSSTITVQIIVNHVINNNYLCKSLKVPNFKFADEDLETKICSKIWKRSLFGHNFNRYRQDPVSHTDPTCHTPCAGHIKNCGMANSNPLQVVSIPAKYNEILWKRFCEKAK